MRRMIMTAMLAVATMLFSCGGSGAPSTGSVALFVTDDMSGYKQVITTINKIQILKPGSAGTTCNLLSNPVTLDISNLSSVMHLLNVSSCVSDSYNTIHVEFDKSVKVMDQASVSATCSFASFKDSKGRTGTLNCDGGKCSIDIDGNYQVFAGTNNLVLDFDLREFTANDFPLDNCTVGMKVSPLDASAIALKKRNGYSEGLTGHISDLKTQAKTFKLFSGTNTFNVNYSGVSRQNIDQLLQFALNNNLKVNVESFSIGTSSYSCSASDLLVKVQGIVSNLNTTSHTFSLAYDKDKSLDISYSDADSNNRVAGQLDNGINVEVKLDGFDGTSYLAYQVEVRDVATED